MSENDLTFPANLAELAPHLVVGDHLFRASLALGLDVGLHIVGQFEVFLHERPKLRNLLSYGDKLLMDLFECDAGHGDLPFAFKAGSLYKHCGTRECVDFRPRVRHMKATSTTRGRMSAKKPRAAYQHLTGEPEKTGERKQSETFIYGPSVLIRMNPEEFWSFMSRLFDKNLGGRGKTKEWIEMKRPVEIKSVL